MPTTPRMRWPFPAENQDPWYDALESFFEAADLSVYASRESENLIITGGGDVSYASGVVSWTDDLAVLAPITGFNWLAVAASVTIEDGYLLWFDAVRAPSTNMTVVLQASPQLPLSDTAVLLAVRRGDTLFWRNGAGIADGETLNPLAFGAAGGGGGGTGDVTGPVSVVDRTIAVWDGTSGDTLADSGLMVNGRILSAPDAVAGNSVEIEGGSATAGIGGRVAIRGGFPSAGGGAGGAVDIEVGESDGVDVTGENITLTAADATGTGLGGHVRVRAGLSPGSTGGSIQLRVGEGADAANDGLVVLQQTPSSNRAVRLRFIADDNGTIDIKAPAVSNADYALTLPDDVGGAGTVLQNDGSGALSWASVPTTPTGVTEIDETLSVADATPTTIHTFTPSFTESRGYFVYEVLVTMIGFGGTYATFKTLASFTYSGIDGFAEREVLHVSGPLRSDPTFDLTFVLVGPDIEMQVTGGADPTLWRAVGRIQLIEDTWAEA